MKSAAHIKLPVIHDATCYQFQYFEQGGKLANTPELQPLSSQCVHFLVN